MKNALLLLVFLTQTAFAQEVTVSISDVVNFWEAYDSVQTTKDTARQLHFIKTLYEDRGSVGLKEMQELRGGTPEKWLKMMIQNKASLEVKRPQMLSVMKQKPILDKKLARLRELYDDFKGGAIYYVVGIGNSGGTLKGNHALIGTEVAANETDDWAIEIVSHEFIHTLQKIEGSTLLAAVIQEGMADFGAELVYNERTLAELFPTNHTAFGLKNEAAIWADFKKYMHLIEGRENYYGWLYAARTVNGTTINDLGYFVGYQICKSYYNKAVDKKKAFKDMLEWDFADQEKTRQFLLESGYLNKKDEKYARKMVFSNVPPNAKVGKLKVIGYKVKDNNIVFDYQLTGVQKEAKTVSIAGSFNSWKANETGYMLQNIGADKFELTLPVSQFEKGKTYQFKFVVGENDWQNPPPNAKNTAKEGNYTNLAFTL
ncbi:MAG: DUF2268 domain-containing putative Zn-dependent protease [Saprospiraceae bacterium]|nr:DUF2268 domain-containing putative Zn-dependent protease [Saprospiraceae bacterium]